LEVQRRNRSSLEELTSRLLFYPKIEEEILMGNLISQFFKNMIPNSSSSFNMDNDERDYKEPDGEELGISMTDVRYFGAGELYPPVEHRERVDRYKKNKRIFKGEHFEVFKNYNGSKQYKDLLYVSVNLSGVICKKSADFLFGEAMQIKADTGDASNEQKAFDRFTADNCLNLLSYESALSNAYKGDSFIKIRYGQEFSGEMPKELDPFRVIIEPVDPAHIFPETALYNKNKILAYHMAVPVLVDVDGESSWQLFCESNFSGRIEYRVYNLSVIETRYYGGSYEVVGWKIDDEVIEGRSVVLTGVPMPLIVHIPNYSTADSWEGIDDVTEHMTIFEEINNRLTQIADILEKHANPAMAVPSGVMGEDAEGNPTFNVSADKVFEVMGKDDIIPSYITWNGQLNESFMELDKLIDLLLVVAEIPAVAIGRSSSGTGTSGTSGLAIKFRMNSLLAKINRKRQYYDRGIKQIFAIAQMLEKAVDIADYELSVPQLTFHDGLPQDDIADATMFNIRTGGAKTISQKTAIMRMDNLTNDQAEAEIEQITEEAKEAQALAPPPVDGSLFNQKPLPTDPTDTTKFAEGSPVTDQANKDLSKNGTKKGGN
jgi:hypothetical protein